MISQASSGLDRIRLDGSGLAQGRLSRCNQCDRRWRVISHTIALGEHEGSLRRILHALKYERRTSLGSDVARELCGVAAPVLRGADVLVPVPLHPVRAWWRGFNQARLIAEGIGLPVVDALARTRLTTRQHALARDDRWQNLSAVIAARPNAATHVLDKTVVVVDDVVTTGATVIACARALRAAGAADVRVLTAARAVRRLPR